MTSKTKIINVISEYYGISRETAKRELEKGTEIYTR